jgi:hypothetical protein
MQPVEPVHGDAGREREPLRLNDASVLHADFAIVAIVQWPD